MKSNFFMILLVILIILVISIIYLKIAQKEKSLESEIESKKKLNHNLKLLLKSKLSIFNLSKSIENENLRPLNEDDLIIIQKEDTNSKAEKNE
ncbi:MAG: hypothetical protein GYA61_01565 [Spirochaetales bacterium]|nr:hypothetical protein [Exilispira sp.]NMC66891.1 hypothetical protein [Spirochaetales bacterium]